jgi:hypothetical protein
LAKIIQYCLLFRRHGILYQVAQLRFRANKVRGHLVEPNRVAEAKCGAPVAASAGPAWLIGRQALPLKKKNPNPTQTPASAT